MQFWKHQHSNMSKHDIERQWRQTHKEVARQLAPFLSDVHEKPPLASTFDFLDTVQALDVPYVHLLPSDGDASISSGSCLSISCVLPSLGRGRWTREQRGEVANTEHDVPEDHGRCTVDVGTSTPEDVQQYEIVVAKQVDEECDNACQHDQSGEEHGVPENNGCDFSCELFKMLLEVWSSDIQLSCVENACTCWTYRWCCCFSKRLCYCHDSHVCLLVNTCPL